MKAAHCAAYSAFTGVKAELANSNAYSPGVHKKPEALTSGFFLEHPHADSNRGSMTENHMS